MRALLLLGFLIATSSFDAKADWASDYARNTDRVARARVQETGSSRTKKILAGVVFESNEGDAIPNAYAGYRNGVPTIGITPAFMALTSYISEISALSIVEGPQWQDCLTEYSTYVRDATKQMATNAYNGEKWSPLMAPEDFGGSCIEIQSKYPFFGQAKIVRDAMLSKALMFTYFHELGHIVLGHIDPENDLASLSERNNARSFLETTCQQRHRERAADRYSVRILVDLGWGDSAFDVTIWSVLMAAGSIDPSLEQLANHPSPSARMADALQEAQAYYVGSGGKVPEEMAILIGEAVGLQKKIEDKLPPFRFPGAEDFRCGRD
jgi:hypothetical protein